MSAEWATEVMQDLCLLEAHVDRLVLHLDTNPLACAGGAS
jgi:hypothetical protein